MTDIEGLAYVFEIADLMGFQLGEHESMTDYVKQETTWNCWGCEGTGYARWPEWKLEFTHKQDCRYLAARGLLEARMSSNAGGGASSGEAPLD